METKIPSLTQELSTLLPSLPILICYHCRSSLTSQPSETHLSVSPHSLSHRTATQIQEYLSTLWPQLLSTFDFNLIPYQSPPFNIFLFTRMESNVTGPLHVTMSVVRRRV